MKKVLIFILAVFLLVSIATAVEFSPQGNINLLDYYNITNLSYVTAYTMEGNINLNDYNITSADYIYANYLNATELIAEVN